MSAVEEKEGSNARAAPNSAPKTDITVCVFFSLYFCHDSDQNHIPQPAVEPALLQSVRATKHSAP